jgi:hypothetical protein
MAMTRFPLGAALGAACFVATMLSGGRASAQDAQPPLGALASLGSETGQGPMSIERLQQGWTIAPDVKFTHFDGGTRTLAGAYGGWVIDNTLMIGGAGYWLTDPNRTRKLSYGGAVVEWREGADQSIGFSVKGLLGMGSATVSRAVTLVGVDPDHGAPPSASLGTATLAFREEFLVAEPQIDLLLKIAPHMRLHVGGGYRAVSNANGLDREIRGATGSVSLEFGPWSRR